MSQRSPRPLLLRTALHLSFLTIGLVAAGGPAYGQTRAFTNANGNWNTSSNWAGSVLPGLAETALIDGNRTVNVTDNRSVRSVHIGYTSTTGLSNFLNIAEDSTLTLSGESRIAYSAGTQGTVTVDGSWTGITDLYVGGGGTGTLTVGQTGSVQANGVQVGSLNGAVGTINLNGAMSSTTLSVGHANGGTGTLNVGSTGSWTASSTLTVGSLGHATNPGGSGSLIIANGGSVTSAGLTTLGSNLNTAGSALVRGTLTNTGDFRVGSSGAGKLTIGEGGKVNVNGGTGILSLAFAVAAPAASGVLNIGGDVVAGTPGTAEGAGILNANEVRGRASGGTSTVNFNHTDSNYYFTKTGTNAGSAILLTGATTTVHSYSGTTVLNAANTYGGGTVISGATARIIADHTQALGTQSVTARNQGVVQIAANRSITNQVTLDEGHLILETGSHVNSVQFVGGGSTVAGSGTFAAGLMLQSGNTLAAGGNDVGTLFFGDTLNLLAGSFTEIDISGFSTGEYDLLSGAGNDLVFGGELRIKFEDGFAFTGEVVIFDFSSYSGNFSNILFQGLSDDYLASFNLETGSVSVEAIPEPSSLALLVGAAGISAILRRRLLKL